MATSTIKGGVVSFSLTRNTTNTANGYGFGKYDRTTGLVSINFWASSTGASATDTLFTVPNDYKPKSDVSGSCIALNANNAIQVNNCVIDTSGNLTQKATGTATRVMGVIEYKI